ncbi:MAG: hypothetical protein KAH54_04610 [Candidatus Sabulitectum sp.]|nr:hypothetical protein [Candidatus Sabulitectum sp.]
MVNEKVFIKIIRWTARITSAITALLILMFFVGEGFHDRYQFLFHLPLKDSLMMITFFILWLGLIIGWKRELTGGLLTVTGLGVFYLIDYLFSGSFPRGPYFLVFASPGFFFLYCGVKSREHKHD